MGCFQPSISKTERFHALPPPLPPPQKKKKRSSFASFILAWNLSKPQNGVEKEEKQSFHVWSSYKRRMSIGIDNSDIFWLLVFLSSDNYTHEHFRMRSIINHLKQSRDFPRLRIGKLINHFSFSFKWKSDLFSLEYLSRYWAPHWEVGCYRLCSKVIHQGRTRRGLYLSAEFLCLDFYVCAILWSLLLSSMWLATTWKAETHTTLIRTYRTRTNPFPHVLQLNLTINRSLQAVRIMLLEGFNKGATFVNTPQPSEMLNKWKCLPSEVQIA